MTADQEATEINRGYLDHFHRWARTTSVSSITDRLLFGRPTQILCLPLVPIVALAVYVRLLLWRVFRSRATASDLHVRAIEFVDEFCEQYPLHLYPIVAKSLELAFLKSREVVPKDSTTTVLEIATGEGTFSRRLFGDSHSITAVDLSPYSLVKAAHLPHISQAVICDGLNPPFAPDSYDLLISNNFLHHVTQKPFALSNWARVARRIVFNENTTTWATGWPLPYLLRRLGLRTAARRAAMRIERRSLQSLLAIQALDVMVESVVSVTERESFLSERTFFYCGLFSLVLRCYGPPTPALFKRLALGPFRSVSLASTRALAKLLILFDAAQDRGRDAFVEFICDGHPSSEVRAAQFVCPSCGTGLGSRPTSCAECGATFPTRDGLLFVLPTELREVLEEYSSEAAASMPREHL